MRIRNIHLSQNADLEKITAGTDISIILSVKNRLGEPEKVSGTWHIYEDALNDIELADGDIEDGNFIVPGSATAGLDDDYVFRIWLTFEDGGRDVVSYVMKIKP